MSVLSEYVNVCVLVYESAYVYVCMCISVYVCVFVYICYVCLPKIFNSGTTRPFSVDIPSLIPRKRLTLLIMIFS